MNNLKKLSCIALMFVMMNEANAAKSEDGEKIDLSVIEARLADVEAAVAGNDIDIGNLQFDVGALQSDVGALQSDVGALQFQDIAVDCASDPSALQAAIDTAPPSGASITSTGTCGPVVINGKRNLEINGQGSTIVSGDTNDGLDAAVFVSASQNIKINGLTVNAGGDVLGLVGFASTIAVSNSDLSGAGFSALAITDTTNASLENVTIDGTLYGEKGASYRTENVTINSADTALVLTNNASFQGADLSFPSNGNPDPNIPLVSVSNGSSMQIDDGFVGGLMEISEGSSINLAPKFDQSVVIDGTLSLFRNSTLLARGEGVTLTEGGLLLIYYGSTAAFGDGATVSSFRAIIQFNSVLTWLTGGADNFSPSVSVLRFGSGVRNIPNDAVFVNIDVCDTTSWTVGSVSCP